LPHRFLGLTPPGYVRPPHSRLLPLGRSIEVCLHKQKTKIQLALAQGRSVAFWTRDVH